MSILILVHIASGLSAVASGVIAVAGLIVQRRMPRWNAVFLLMTTVACATGFAFLPTQGVTSAQLVSLFLTMLITIAAFARYRRQLDGSWNQVYALSAVGSLFLNLLITIAQSFLHVKVLRALAPSQQSPAYVIVKMSLLLVFVIIAIVAVRRADRS